MQYPNWRGRGPNLNGKSAYRRVIIGIRKNNMKKEEPQSEIIIYRDEDSQSGIKVYMCGETVWLTQKQLAELFDTTKQNISQHIGNIFKDGELSEDSVVKKILTTADDEKEYNTEHYNLKMIISLGYHKFVHCYQFPYLGYCVASRIHRQRFYYR